MADVKEEAILGPAIRYHWYYLSKAQALIGLLRSPHHASLDIGAGSGFFSRTLVARGLVQEATCVDPGYVETKRTETITGRPITFVQHPGNRQADLVLMMDVLEHVDHDLALLREYVVRSSSGTVFIITVPAFMALWSQHDVFLEHKRRYTLRQLEKVVVASGLEITGGCYYFALIFPLVAVIRRFTRGQARASSLKKHTPFINGVLRMVCFLELTFYRFNRLGGLTVFCVARKP